VYRVATIFFVLCSAGSAVALAQPFRVQEQETVLTIALSRFTIQSGIDVVFSRTQAEKWKTTCTYNGPSARDALVCLVTDLPFRVQEISRNQYVLIPLLTDSRRVRSHVLSGFVVDATTGETLVGAHVRLPDMGAGAVTNEAGYFALPGVTSGRRRLLASYIGFETVDSLITVDGRALSLALTPQSVTVEGVTVESSPSLRADLATTPGLVSMPPAHLRELPGALGSNDVLETLRWLPGIERAGEATGGLMIRGSGPDQNLYLIDGVPIYHPWHAFSLVSTFQTGTFKDINLYRGAFPAEYGGRLSGVLDAELRDGGRSEPHVQAGINALHGRFLIETPVTPRSSFMLSGRRSYIDQLIGNRHPVSDDAGRRDTLRTGYYFYDWSAKFSYRPDEKSSLSISWYSGRDVLDLRLPFDVSLDFSSFLRPADLFFEVGQSWGNRLASARYQRLLSQRLFLTTILYESRYDAEENTFIQPTQTASVASSYSVSVQDLGLRSDMDWYLSLRHHVRFGIQWVDRRFDSDVEALLTYSPGFDEDIDEHLAVDSAELAAYIQDLWRPTPRWRILPGIRVSYFGGGRYLRAAPRMNAQFVVHPDRLSLRAAATTQVQYLQRIQDRQARLYDLVSSRWVPADDMVPPSRSGQLTTGLEYQPVRGLTLTADVYLRRSRNVLLPDNGFQARDQLLGSGIEVSGLLAQYVSGEERSQGLELGLDYQHARWRIVTSFTRSRTQDKPEGPGEPPWRAARFDTPRNASVVAQWASGTWLWGVSALWRSGYPVTEPTGRFASTHPATGETTLILHVPEENNGRLPNYFRTDVHASYRFRAWNADWKAGIDIFNTTIRRNTVAQSFDASDPVIAPRSRKGLPLIPLFEIEMSLR